MNKITGFNPELEEVYFGEGSPLCLGIYTDDGPETNLKVNLPFLHVENSEEENLEAAKKAILELGILREIGTFLEDNNFFWSGFEWDHDGEDSWWGILIEDREGLRAICETEEVYQLIIKNYDNE